MFVKLNLRVYFAGFFLNFAVPVKCSIEIQHDLLFNYICANFFGTLSKIACIYLRAYWISELSVFAKPIQAVDWLVKRQRHKSEIIKS